MTTRVSCFLSSSLRLDLRHTHLVMTIYYLYAKELSDTTAQRIIGAPSMVILLGHDECEPRVVGTENHVSVVTETVSSTQTTTIRHSTHQTIFGHVLLKLTFHTKAISHRCSIVSRNGSTEDCHLSFSGKKKKLIYNLPQLPATTGPRNALERNIAKLCPFSTTNSSEAIVLSAEKKNGKRAVISIFQHLVLDKM